MAHDRLKRAGALALGDLLRVGGALVIGYELAVFAVPFAHALDQPEFAPWLTFLGGGFIAVGFSHVLRRLLFHRLDLQAIAQRAIVTPVGAGMVFLGVCIVLAAFVLMQGAATRL